MRLCNNNIYDYYNNEMQEICVDDVNKLLVVADLAFYWDVVLSIILF